MSTKIWHAFRTPTERLNDAIDFLHDHMWQGVYGDYKKMLAAVKPEVLAEKYGEDSDGLLTKHLYRHWCVSDTFKKLKELCDKDGSDLPVMQCSLNIWLHDGFAYIIPYGPYEYYAGLYVDPEEGSILANTCPHWLEDYHYQNQTDHPEHMTYEDFAKRGEVWRQVNLGKEKSKTGWNARRLHHSIFEPSTAFWVELQLQYEDEEKAKEGQAT